MEEEQKQGQQEAQFTWDVYQGFVQSTKQYSDQFRLMYPVLGLASEAGEVAGKVKKILRDKDGQIGDEEVRKIVDELSDVLWYVTCVADDLNVPLEVVARVNVQKLSDRMERSKIKGDGDNR
jgi:NTP pyrophosphatase (non-canonical NTP hydrolase)